MCAFVYFIMNEQNFEFNPLVRGGVAANIKKTRTRVVRRCNDVVEL